MPPHGRVAHDGDERDERGELGSALLVGQRGGAGDRVMELAGPGRAEGVVRAVVDGVEVGVDAGAVEGLQGRADAHVDLRLGVTSGLAMAGRASASCSRTLRWTVSM